MIFNVDIQKLGDNEDTVVVVEPTEQLSNKEYDKIKPIIENLGGHWRERYRAFVFPPTILKRNYISRWKEESQFFPTPVSVVGTMLYMSGLCIKHPDEHRNNLKIARILEPSAGQGAILDIVKKNINTPYTLQAVEPDPSNIKILKASGYNVAETTFENFYEQNIGKHSYTHILMNPPFSLGRDMKHIRLAYDLLDKDGILVSVMSENSLYYDCDETRDFVKWLNKNIGTITPIPSFSFSESGTSIETVLITLRK